MSRTALAPVAVRLALHLREHGPHTVTELAQALEISRTSVETALVGLEGSGIAADAPASTTKGAGRPARRFAFQSSHGVVVGVDVGAHSIRVLLADLAGVVLAQTSAPGLRPDADGATQLDQVVSVMSAAAAEAGVSATRFRAIGVSLPGIVDDSGRVLASVVIPTWAGIDIVAHLRSAFSCPIVVDNGVRLAAVAEHHLGAARLIDEVLYLSVGNRVAAGLILEGRPRRGVHNVAGDIGRLAFRGLNARTGQIDWRSAADAEAVFRRAEEGDADARRELDAFVDELAHGIATLVMTVDPAIVVIGGGLSLARERLLAPLREAVTRHIGLPIDVPIVGARLGADAAAHGALAFAFARCTSDIYGIPQMSPPPLTPLPQAPAPL
ncbi:ROK family protein [Microbacterium tumbae]